MTTRIEHTSKAVADVVEARERCLSAAKAVRKTDHGLANELADDLKDMADRLDHIQTSLEEGY